MRLREFAPARGGNSGDYLKALASAWYNGVFDTGSLPRGIKTQEDVERLLNRGIVCPDGKTRKLHIDYNSDFDGVEIYSDDYYEHGDLDGNDGRTGQPWGPYDHMEFGGDELDEGVAEGSLNEFAPGGGGDDDHQDPYGAPKPEHYDRSIDFFGQFEADHFDDEDMNDATGEFKGYWYYDGKPRQIAYFKFDNPRRTGSNHPGVGWYYEPQNEGVAEGYKFKGGFPFDVDHMPGAVHRNSDMITDNVKTKDKAEWDRATDSINARVFDDMAEFRTDSKGETVVGDSAVWAKWDNATQTGWFNAKGRPLKPWPVKEQGVAEGINDSSKDYGTDEVTITFDGDIPSEEEIIQYCKKNYGFVPASIDIEPPSDFRGMSNPGIIRVKQGVAEGLNEFAPAGGGGNIPRGPKTPRRGPWDDGGEDPYQLRRYNRSVDFFDQFDSDGVDKQNFDKATGEYEGYYFDRDAASGITQIAYFKFDDPTKIGDNDPGIGWYYEPIDEGVAEGLNEFAPDSNDGGEEDALHKYAKMWWAGDEATQMQIERALAKMGWEIGEDEGSYDNGGVFVVRAGDENGNSYTSWAAEDLIEARKKKKKKSSKSLRGYFFPGYGYYGTGDSGEGGGDGGGESKNRGMTEGSDPWGSEGRFVGDTGPTQVSTTVPRVQLQIGDRVVYKPTEQRASIAALSRDGTKARIHIPSPMGGRTFNCRTADLKALGSLKENRNLCNVCGQTPCNCTH